MSDTIFTIASFLESSDEKIRSFAEAVERNTWAMYPRHMKKNFFFLSLR